ncbi:MAG TPA: hypothetical protein VF297_09630 [Pyrinomonadaceae bacterium]
MTWEEAERLMTFIREQQARINATLARIDERLNRPMGKVDHIADRAMALLATVRHAREIRKFDERLNALINTVERHISEGRNGKA